MSARAIPEHLKKYVVDQEYDRYTFENQASWRFVLRQLRHFLGQHAHAVYIRGLEQTGITIESIPRISEIDSALRKFGWSAVPVSGFIPPAAFMEFQSLGVLPIAADMRSVEHILYTPAPDIVHEAAGHAPIIVEPAYSSYLRSYASIANKAIISREDVSLYEAIRVLSDIKENPESTPAAIAAAEKKVAEAAQAITHVSEAGYLSRMNWWTAEYGLIGDSHHPRIYGAGLLSSVGEAKRYLGESVKKIPLDLDCINYSYDITEPQPQLFVTPSFEHLTQVLEQLAQTMAFRLGGLESCMKAIRAQSVNSFVLDSGVAFSGLLTEAKHVDGKISFLRASGPCQISVEGNQIEGHGPSYHSKGFSTPVGAIREIGTSIDRFTEADLVKFNLVVEKTASLRFESGILVTGNVQKLTRKNGKLLMITFSDCTVTDASGVKLFEPSWGSYDLICGNTVTSVFGGAADRGNFDNDVGFLVARVPRKTSEREPSGKEYLYSEIRKMRASKSKDAKTVDQWRDLRNKMRENWPDQWLIGVELLELGHILSLDASLINEMKDHLTDLAKRSPSSSEQIFDGLNMANQAL